VHLSVIVPCYNEELDVVQVLKRLQEVLSGYLNDDFEVIVVDDCSTDSSLAKITEFCENQSAFQVITQSVNRGKGAAIKKGFEHSKGNYIVIQDADLELSCEDIPTMLEQVNDQVDFVNGSRYMPGVIRPLYAYKRYFLNKQFTRLASLLVDVRYTDIACGYKLFSRELLNKIELKENRFGIEAEMIIKASRLSKNSIVEVPVHYFPRNKGEGKKIRNIDGFRIFWVILKYGLFVRS
jgi:glycosyltransferase involved in cell wall biosynthesis